LGIPVTRCYYYFGLVKRVFKEYKLFFRAFWNWNRPFWFWKKSPDDSLFTSYKVGFIFIALAFLVWIEQALFY